MRIRVAIVFIEVDGGLRTMGLVFHKGPYQAEGNEGREICRVPTQLGDMGGWFENGPGETVPI